MTEFKQAIRWNLGSLVFLAISGFLLNIIIGEYYNPATLGIFNQVLGVYFFFSMLGVGGINLSALQLLSSGVANTAKPNTVVQSALLLTAATSFASTLVFYLLSPTISELLKSPGLLTGLLYITPGLFLFGLNKTLLSVVNGLNRMRAFAILQSLRYLNLLVGLILAIYLSVSGDKLSFIFTFTESILFIVLCIYLREFLFRIEDGLSPALFKRHATYGTKAFLSGALLELNARTDILMIGYFMSDKATGIYSFAALAFEGLNQFIVALQNNYNPHMSKLVNSARNTELHDTIIKGRNITYKYALGIIPLATLAFPVAITIFFPSQPDFIQGWLPFGILMAGLFLVSGYLPFHGILSMANLPGWQSIQMLLMVLSNVALNALFIPMFGIAGAALGTTIALIISTLVVILVTRYKLNISLY